VGGGQLCDCCWKRRSFGYGEYGWIGGYEEEGRLREGG